MFALILAVEHAEVDGVIDFFTDSLITANTFSKGPRRAKFACNADLWCQLFQSRGIKNLMVKVYWMPSHTDTNPAKKEKAPSWMQDWHVKGNNAADKGADKGAVFMQFLTIKPSLCLINLRISCCFKAGSYMQ